MSQHLIGLARFAQFGFSRFAVGTLIGEPLLLSLGRFSTASPRRGYVPYIGIPFATKTTIGARRELNSGHSLPQARFWIILFAGCLQLVRLLFRVFFVALMMFAPSGIFCHSFFYTPFLWNACCFLFGWDRYESIHR